MSKPRAEPVGPGDPAPDFVLTDSKGKRHRLSDYRGQWVVLYFYPRDQTPGCTIQACDFQAARSGFQRNGAVVLGISPDSIESHAKFEHKYGLEFTLLSDPDKEVARLFGVWRKKLLYGKSFLGIVRSTFLIDPDGRVHTALRKVKAKGHVDLVRKLLREARAGATA